MTPNTHADPHRDPSAPRDAQRRWALAIVGAILVVVTGAAMRATSTVAIPVVLAVFVTLAVLPLDRAVAARLPHGLSWLGRTAVMVLLVLILGLFLGGLAYCVTQIATQLPDLSTDMGEILPATQGDDLWARVSRSVQGLVQSSELSVTSRLIDIATSFAQTMASAAGVVLAGMILVLFLILLALSEADVWEAKLDSLSADPNRSWQDVTTTLGSALRRFIATRAVVGVISSVAYTVWLLPFGLDLLLVWAVLTFLMNFIPNLGSLVSGFFPTIYAFLTQDFGTALLIGAGLIVIEQVIGNWLDPRLQGNEVALSPLVILIAVVFWGWLWGVAGAFLGTPMTLAIMIICNAINPLRPIALLLSNQKRPEDLDRALA